MDWVKPLPPSFVSVTFNALRIPAALILSTTFLALDGIWWSISISSVFKGYYPYKLVPISP